MRKQLSILLLALASASCQELEQSLPCNPLYDPSCAAHDRALSGTIEEDFSRQSPFFDITADDQGVEFCDSGLKLTLNERFDNPTITSNFYIMFGRVEVSLKSANGKGIISSFYLQSDDLDEIDLEWFGSDMWEVQTNYFSKGNTTTYDRGQYHHTSIPPQEAFHTYTIDWTEDELTWYVDHSPIRTLYSDSPSGYPQSPMFIKFSLWAGGDPNNEMGTIQWAGGETDYSEAPFSMYVDHLIVTDYSSGNEYTYGDRTGSWSSIHADDGLINGRKEQGDEEFSFVEKAEKQPPHIPELRVKKKKRRQRQSLDSREEKGSSEYSNESNSTQRFSNLNTSLHRQDQFDSFSSRLAINKNVVLIDMAMTLAIMMLIM